MNTAFPLSIAAKDSDLHVRRSRRAMRYLADETLAELQQLARTFRANVLIVGPLAASQRDEILLTVKRQSGRDLLHAQGPSGLMLPVHGAVDVVLDDVCACSADDQDRLLEWISRNDRRIVSFASHSLYAMVCAGSFREQLYYRLNTVCVVLSD